MLQAIKKFFTTHEIALATATLCVVALSGWLTWGKMPFGDNTVELGYGLMARSGLVPYSDFYIHITPLTTTLAAFFESTRWPIHLANLFMIGNLLLATAVVFFFGKLLRLSMAERILGFIVFYGLYITTLVGFNHHPLDLTFSGGSFLFLIGILHTNDRHKIKWLVVATAVCAVLTFFCTQHIGVATLAAGPTILLLVWLGRREKIYLLTFVSLLAAEAIVMIAALLLVATSGISVPRMLKTTLFTGYTQYTGTYGHWPLWKDAWTNIMSGISKRIVFTPTVQVTAKSSEGNASFVPAGTIATNNYYYKIFLNKSGFINTLFNIATLFYILVMAAAASYILIKSLLAKQFPHPFIVVWIMVLGIFIVASSVVFNTNFSGFYFIFLLWQFVIRTVPQRLGRILRVSNFLVFGTLGSLLLLANSTILFYEHATRENLVSRVGNETVWLSPFYYHDFIAELIAMEKVLDGLGKPAQLYAYPRASEIFYLLNKVPPRGTTLATFFQPNGQYQSALRTALASDIVVIFMPKFYSDDLGPEHDFAMQVIKPDLIKNYRQLFNSHYFAVYQKKNYAP